MAQLNKISWKTLQIVWKKCSVFVRRRGRLLSRFIFWADTEPHHCLPIALSLSGIPSLLSQVATSNSWPWQSSFLWWRQRIVILKMSWVSPYLTICFWGHSVGQGQVINKKYRLRSNSDFGDRDRDRVTVNIFLKS